MTDAKQWPPCPTGAESTCRIQLGPSSTTLMYAEPTYDRQGNLVSDDRGGNTLYQGISCVTCGARWRGTRPPRSDEWTWEALGKQQALAPIIGRAI